MTVRKLQREMILSVLIDHMSTAVKNGVRTIPVSKRKPQTFITVRHAVLAGQLGDILQLCDFLVRPRTL